MTAISQPSRKGTPLVTFIRWLAAFIGGVLMIVAATMYGGLYFISYLINDSSVDWSLTHTNLRLGTFATVLILAVAIVVFMVTAMWTESKGWTIAVVVFFLLFLSEPVAIGFDRLVRLMTSDLGWTKGEIGFYVGFIAFTTALIAFAITLALFSNPTGKKKGSKKPKQVVHLIRLDLGAVAQRTPGTFPAFLRGRWIAWRAAEGLAFGSLASVALLWHTPLTDPQITMRIIWTCVVLSAFAGVVLGLAFALTHFQAYGILPRLGTETAVVTLIASYNTAWFWLVLALAAIGAAITAVWIVRSRSVR